ncbi:MAG: GTPase [Armatimonadota bacterium]|nr:GTPase [Armatimonadota bacterium]MDR7422554.1 GTPase [Armatimonadota bacterium]MDR7454223.1 GTPase [Armatimonadota bacterium]MDR7457326.1 GTPase [Armatimonadota bacterium]MDR7497301.1 GTPase [Armatimonadota bacterium]
MILGAGGRDFHVFNTWFRDRADAEVVAFTAAQIPNIAGRRYPPVLAGPRYPEGIPIVEEDRLAALVREQAVEQVIFAYSDVTHEHVMHLASTALAAGAGFRLLGPRETMLPARVPVVAICAVRTGAGKSPTTRYVTARLRALGRRPAVVRHPMAYGDLVAQRIQRFASDADLDRAGVTVEEREEYEPHLARGTPVFAGVDYAEVIRAAEAEADVLVWDGGNNDFPFVWPDLHIVLADPHRPGHETRYHPGEANLRMAHVVVIAKVDTAPPEGVRAVRAAVARANPAATVVEAAMPPVLEAPERVVGRRVVVVEDGPTLTHGEMPHGAGFLAAVAAGARVVDVREAAVGRVREAFAHYPHLGPVLPAMGYDAAQLRDLEATINRAAPEVVVLGTPADLGRLLRLRAPVVRARYELEDRSSPTLGDLVARWAAGLPHPGR